MNALYLLVPMSLVLVCILAWAVIWAIRAGQFDDLVGPAYRVLMDEDGAPDEIVGPKSAALDAQADAEKSGAKSNDAPL